MTIRLRLVLVVALTTAVLVAVGGVAFAASLSSGMRATLEDSLRRTARRVDAEVAAHRIPLGSPLPSADPAWDGRVVQVLGPTGRVRFTTVRAGAGSLLGGAELALASHGRIVVQVDRATWRDPRLLLAEPLPGSGHRLLVVGASLDEVENAMVRVRDAFLAGGPLVVVLAMLGGWLLAGRALLPVERLRAEAAAISVRIPDHRLAEPDTNDEVARLAGTLNSLLDRLQGALTRQREFVAVASHELRTPLAVLQAELELASRPGRTEGEVRQTLEVLGPRVDQLVRLAGDLLLLARGDEAALPLQLAPRRLEPLVSSSLGSLCGVADVRGVVLALDADPEVTAAVDDGRFQQVVDNLVGNALEHGGDGELVEVSVRAEHGEPVLEVRDHGPGFPDDLLEEAFERFTRGDTARRRSKRGAGLGLAIVRLLVEAHGGTVTARNMGDGGASVVVRLPACAAVVDERAAVAHDRTGPDHESLFDTRASTKRARSAT